jgi:hypothetical protein
MHAVEPKAELNRPAAQGIGVTIALALQYAPGMHALHAISFVEPSLGLKLGVVMQGQASVVMQGQPSKRVTLRKSGNPMQQAEA